MPVVVPPRGGDMPDIELKDYYIDENGQQQERVRKVILPKFGTTEENDDSFSIFGDEE